MCNYSSPKTYLYQRVFPPNPVVVAFFDVVEGKLHQCAMYNLYKSVAFFKEAYNNKKITDSWCYNESN